jgi:2-polyprenyl-6-methoxyphenol hydroxylase-like FAD-dependent oxidoreductase
LSKNTLKGSDVLIVGGRTTGLMLAIRLRRQGLSVRVADSSPSIDPHSRATLLHSRSLELLENLGIVEEIVTHGQDLRGMRLFVDGAFVMEAEHPPVDSPYPYGIAYSQVRIERLLEERLNDLGVEVERSTALLALEQDTASVRARLGHADGTESMAEASWLVGCDGAHSTTRHLLGIDFPGWQSRYPYMLADVVVENDKPSHAFFSFLHGEGSLYFFILDGGRRQIVAGLPEGHPTEGHPNLAEVQALVDRRSGGDYRLSDPRWLAYFRISYRLAERYRQGRVFLAGDAAHLNSLVGGHGMNTGIQDACNLAWKLTLANRGLVSNAFLDSFEAERRPVAKEMISGSCDMTEPGEAYPTMTTDEREALINGFRMNSDDLMAFRRNFEELDLDYGESPLSRDEGQGLPGEVRPGLEARNLDGLQHNGQTCDLFSLLGGPKHTLLIFAGEEDEEERAASLLPSADANPSWIESFLVVSRATARDLPKSTTLIIDPESRLAHRYGMQKGGLYLIRPDGYVAYRGTEAGGLARYLEEVMQAS